MKKKSPKKSKKAKKRQQKLDQGTVEAATTPKKGTSNPVQAQKEDDKDAAATASSKKISSKKIKSKTTNVKEPTKRVSIEPPGTPPADTQAQNMHSWNKDIKPGQQTIEKANKNFEQTTDNKNASTVDEKEEIQIIKELFNQPLDRLKQVLGLCRSSNLDQ